MLDYDVLVLTHPKIVRICYSSMERFEFIFIRRLGDKVNKIFELKQTISYKLDAKLHKFIIF